MEGCEDVVTSRISLRDLSGLSESCFDEEVTSVSSTYHDERKWRLSYLKSQFESFKLDTLYKTYTEKINHGYFSLFLILQCILSLMHLVIIIVSNKERVQNVFVDIILYSITLLSSVIGLCVVDKIQEKYHKLHYLSVCAFIVIFFGNYFIPYYYSGNSRYKSAYSAHLILSCYLFFGIQNLTVASVLGFSVSIVDIITSTLVTYTSDDVLWRKLMSDIIFLSFMNVLGIYYRNMNEIVVRHSFLDRRDYIMSTHQLKHEKQQVENLMQNILPHYIIDKVKEKYIKATTHYLKNGKVLRMNPFQNSLLDEHENVSILFADIVNYTEMTTQLDITGLLETLNDLFGAFDDASVKLKVTRIKFLGDCYYCVAGLPPDAAPNPAEACVDLGLEMISTIAKIRKQRNLDINMRIGVHSGRIISGIMGSVKYQFDIWSKDVDIANKMESEGCPGKVHITDTTKNLLKKEYNIVSTDKGENVPIFKERGIQTYLISPSNPRNSRYENDMTCNRGMKPRLSKFSKQTSLPNGVWLSQMQRSISMSNEELIGRRDNQQLTIIEEANNMRAVYERTDSGTDKIFKKRVSNNSASMSIIEARRSTNTIKRRTAFMNNSIKRYSERTEAVNEEMEETINSISFSKYQQFKENVDISFFLLFKTKETEVQYMKVPDPLFKYYSLGSFVVILCIHLQIFLQGRWEIAAWHFRGILLVIVSIVLAVTWSQFIYNKFCAKNLDEIPNNKFLRIILQTSKKIMNSFHIRLSLFSMIYFLIFMPLLFEMVKCTNTMNEGHENKTNLTLLNTTLEKKSICLSPWDSETFNPSVEPQLAHIMSVIFSTVLLHLLDRQTDYMNRLAYLLNEKVKSEQEEARELEYVNESLLLNILPKHVAKVYLDVNREMQDLYFEKHDNVAVMFASLITDDDLQDYLDDREFILLMNKYITSFDTISNRREFLAIEKIKIAKWTYMVACGLFPGGKRHELERHHTSSSLETLLGFATEMFRKVQQVNRNQQQQCKLRIGICQGPIVAGVVGAKKPLYDIWGDPVNMASRMDSTGEPNRIQVMESTAEIISNLGYACDYRGEIQVRGRKELVKTYFVKLSSDYNIMKIPFQ
ncbi:adenylate cyclase type 2 isoform X2 [Leptinotarsa decemlineata]|uniref:adenylate cyclase type 2 isoform X2 n=1 Tax=Leptinotarsa decemlineata TaxID=7539 RepID=UPI003D3087B1